MSDNQIIICLKEFGVSDENEVLQVLKAHKTNNYDLASDFLTKKKWQEFRKKVNTKLSIYCRFQPSYVDPSNLTDQAINAVIYGPCGHGKTSFINNICGTNLGSGSSNSSLTREVVQVKTQFDYFPQFVLYDTPGTSSVKDKLAHALFLKEILTWKPLNAILILVKYNPRYDQLITAIMAQLILLKRYEKYIVFLVTHFDEEKDPQLVSSTIYKMLDQLKVANNIILFSNNSCNKRQLADKLYDCARSNPKVKIEIQNEEFLLNFNLSTKVGQQIFLQNDLKLAKQEMKQITQLYADFAVTISSPEKQAILQNFQVQLKNQHMIVLENFQEKFKQTMVGCEFFTSVLSLQKDILDNSMLFQKRVRPSQSYKYIQNQATGYKTDITDLIKRCPNCKQIWFRIEACPNTVCGNRPSCYFDFTKRSSINYKIKRTGKKIIFQPINTENSIKNNQTNKQKIMAKFHEQAKKLDPNLKDINFNPRGCKQTMNFETLPRLPNIEEILKSWYQVDTMQEVVTRFQKDKQLEKQREKLERNIRDSFFSFAF